MLDQSEVSPPMHDQAQLRPGQAGTSRSSVYIRTRGKGLKWMVPARGTFAMYIIFLIRKLFLFSHRLKSCCLKSTSHRVLQKAPI